MSVSLAKRESLTEFGRSGRRWTPGRADRFGLVQLPDHYGVSLDTRVTRIEFRNGPHFSDTADGGRGRRAPLVRVPR